MIPSDYPKRSHLSGACWPLSEKRYTGAHCGLSARSRNFTPIESAAPPLFFATLRVTSRIDKLRNYQASFSARRRTRRAQVFLTPHSSPLSPRLWAVGPIRPSLVRGLRPRNAPSPKPPAAASVWQYDLDDPLRPGFTPPTPRLGRFRVCASAGKTGEATPIYTQRSPL